MNNIDLNLISQFGIAGLMFGGFMFLLKWVLKLKEKILADAKEERTNFLEIIRNFQRSMDKVNELWSQEQTQSDQYIEHARREHQKMIEVATQCCKEMVEFRKENAERAILFRQEHDKMIAHLEEQYKVLLKINGEKHE